MKKNIVLTRDEILTVEQKTEEVYGISRLILMENAGRTLAEIVRKASRKKYKKICVVSGKGNNGGDGFVTARYLFNTGLDVKVIITNPPEEFSALSFTNYKILCKMEIDTFLLNTNRDRCISIIKEADITVDAILGTGIKGRVTGVAEEAISLINEYGRFVICADIPSGLDADSGIVHGKCVKGNITVSFGFAKKGFYINSGPEYCGKIVVTDIGFPRFFYTGEDKKCEK